MSRLRRELTDFHDISEHHDVAQVMVLGDSQAGKTTLILQLLGLAGDKANREAEEVLRGGRDVGESSTAMAVRYRWSPDDSRWMLVASKEAGARLLTSKEMESEVSHYRLDDGRIASEISSPPLEIGIPRRLAGDRIRTDLRILDLPGLHARRSDEQAYARKLIAAYSPLMDLILIVQPVDSFADSLQDSVFSSNLHLSSWSDQTDRFRLVFTKAFSNQNMRERIAACGLEDDGRPSGDAILATVFDYLDAQVRDSTGTSLDRSMLVPVELGKTLKGLRNSSADYYAVVGGTIDLMIDRLRDDIAARSDEDAKYLAGPEIANRVAVIVEKRETERERKTREAEEQFARVRAEYRKKAGRAMELETELAKSAQEVAQLRTALDRLRRVAIPYERPPKPEMTGLAVRSHQVDQRNEWIGAANRAWSMWRKAQPHRAFPTSPPAQLNLSVARTYDSTVDCCTKCTESGLSRWWNGHTSHLFCYGRMNDVSDAMTAAIRHQLVVHATSPVTAAETRWASLQSQLVRAERVAISDGELVATTEAWGEQVMKAAKAERERDSMEASIARSVFRIHAEENAAYVSELLTRAAAADGDDRSWLMLAALQAVQNLDRVNKVR